LTYGSEKEEKCDKVKVHCSLQSSSFLWTGKGTTGLPEAPSITGMGLIWGTAISRERGRRKWDKAVFNKQRSLSGIGPRSNPNTNQVRREETGGEGRKKSEPSCIEGGRIACDPRSAKGWTCGIE